MRKLKLQVQISVDGFIAGPKGEMDWMTWGWDNELNKYVSDLTETIDCILLGRKMTGEFISHWAAVAENPDNPEYELGKKMTGTEKVVFTKTLDKSEWANTVIAKGNLTDEVNKLKNKKGKDIVVYGGANFVSSLIKAGLIDEYHLLVDTVAIGRGMAIFKDLDKVLSLKLVKSIPFACGIVLLHYKPKDR